MTTTNIARTPAKLNLGLEVLTRRSDGYHDILTVMQAVDVFDELAFEADPNGFEYVGDPAIIPDFDIARPILTARAAELGWTGRLRLRKRIPIAAGLGGGSSDAALSIRIAFAGESTEFAEKRAAAIGSDVPFLIRGGCALASGTGTTLEPLPCSGRWFLIIVPEASLVEKTSSMYARLSATDYSSGESVREIAAALRGGIEIPDRLPNAFERAMFQHESVAESWRSLRELTGRVALSGAGPAVFSWFQSAADARDAAARLESNLGGTKLIAKSIPRHDADESAERIARALQGGPGTVSERAG